MSAMSIAFGGIVAFFFRGVNLAVALALIFVCSRQLDTGDYGTFVLGLTVVGIVNAVTGGLTAATAYQVSNQKRAPGTALFNGSLLSLVLGGAAIATGIIVGQSLTGEAHGEALAVGAACAAVILNGVVAGVFLGRDWFVRYNLSLVCPPLFSLVAIAIAFYGFGADSPDVALQLYAAGQWAATLLLLTLGASTLRTFALQPQLIRAVGWFAFVAGLASGVSYLNYRASLFVVDYFEGKDGVATYSLALYIAESVWQVSGSLALATYARLGSASRAEASALTTRVMRHTLVLLALLCVVLFLAAGVIQSVLFPDYPGMASALRFILPGVLLYSLAQSYSGFYTQQRGMPWVSAVVAGGALCIQMAFAFALIPLMGVNGAALASALGYSIAILAGIVIFARSEHLRPAQIFRFGAADVEDYRSLFGRLRALRS